MLGGIIGDLTGGLKNAHLKGSVVLMRKNVLDFNDFGATVVDGITEFIGRGVTCQLISSTVVDRGEHSDLLPTSTCKGSVRLASPRIVFVHSKTR
jgi:linoleate 9S-lipoxygenase